MNARNQRKRSGTVPLIDHDRREGSTLFWDLHDGLSISRDTHDTDVVLYRDGDVTASLSKAQATSMGQRIYREVKDNGADDVRVRYARALCSSAVF